MFVFQLATKTASQNIGQEINELQHNTEIVGKLSDYMRGLLASASELATTKDAARQKALLQSINSTIGYTDKKGAFVEGSASKALKEVPSFFKTLDMNSQIYLAAAFGLKVSQNGTGNTTTFEFPPDQSLTIRSSLAIFSKKAAGKKVSSSDMQKAKYFLGGSVAKQIESGTQTIETLLNTLKSTTDALRQQATNLSRQQLPKEDNLPSNDLASKIPVVIIDKNIISSGLTSLSSDNVKFGGIGPSLTLQIGKFSFTPFYAKLPAEQEGGGKATVDMGNFSFLEDVPFNYEKNKQLAGFGVSFELPSPTSLLKLSVGGSYAYQKQQTDYADMPLYGPYRFVSNGQSQPPDIVRDQIGARAGYNETSEGPVSSGFAAASVIPNSWISINASFRVGNYDMPYYLTQLPFGDAMLGATIEPFKSVTISANHSLDNSVVTLGFGFGLKDLEKDGRFAAEMTASQFPGKSQQVSGIDVMTGGFTIYFKLK